jgi:D-alanyl-D-alanine carboxypeptidase/D-alanyl-D-alanine-endopeptidase (penicillin-binding protein 4)
MAAVTLTRRTVLAGAGAWLAAPGVRRAWAAPEPLAAVLASSGLAALSGFAVADLDGGTIEAHRAEAALPPASVAKLVTALYALEALGPGYRFRTAVLAAGPVEGGRLRGDLVLAGSGDPVLDTDALGGLAQALRMRGLAAVDGRLVVTAGALPEIVRIDDDQPDEAGYNAAVSGMNLNFNRVFLAWGPGRAGPELAFSAPGERFGAPVAGVAAELAAAGPMRHRSEGGREIWTLPRQGLAGRGSIWLPVRTPGAYAGEVFARLASDAGLVLPPAAVVAEAAGAPLALRESPPLDRMLQDMLRYSTNLTAEVLGLRAAQARGARPDGLDASGAAMTGWARARFGLSRIAFANHSGLSDRSSVTAGEMVALLGGAVELGLPELMRERPILGADREPVEIGGVRVVAKTGTLNFASGLAGYMTGRRRLAFAIFAADPAARARVPPEQRDDPPGAAAWAARARAQEQALLRRWAALYAA